MSFLGLTNKRFLIMGLANRKSVAWAIAKSLEEEGAEVIHSVRSEARLESLRKLLYERKVYLCDVEFPEQITTLAEQVSADYGELDGFVRKSLKCGRDPWRYMGRAPLVSTGCGAKP